MLRRLVLRACPGARTHCKAAPPPGDGDPPMVGDFLEDLLSNSPLLLEVDQLDQEELRAVREGSTAAGAPTPEPPPATTLTTAKVKTRKGRSDHYFPKKNKAARASVLDDLKMETVIGSYMSRGHLAALIDPLQIVRRPMFRPEFPSRTVLRQRRVPVDRDMNHLLPNNTSLGEGKYRMKLGDLMKHLNAAYCSTIGFEFTHLNDMECKTWIRKRIETLGLRHINKEQKIYCAKKLVAISELGSFIESSTDAIHRYTIAGSETAPLGLDLLIRRAAKKHGARVFVLGMRRLARFSVLSALGLNQADIFRLMRSSISETVEKHCLGTVFETSPEYLNDIMLKFVMVASPSIPESFFPIVLGMSKGIQDKEGDEDGKKIWPIVIHMARGLNAQGITYETLKLSVLPSYSPHGAIHMVINNQMEQTLKRKVSMTTEYCTDVLKAINAPIFHVNGDDIAAVNFVFRMAADYRAEFHRDVVIDLVSYQRAMASRIQTKFELVQVQEKINQLLPIVPRFLKMLENERVVTKAEIESWKSQLGQVLSQRWHEVLGADPRVDREKWTPQLYMDRVNHMRKTRTFDFDTGVKNETLREICSKLSSAPKGFQINSKQMEILQKRANLVEKDSLDWVICEALAYGSLLLELKNVRISGMDVNRRFHVIQEDKSSGQEYNLLDNISHTQGRYQLCKCTTSQYATAGFEYGYSTGELNTLVVWEAPEGDKTSKAQVIIDHFIAGGFVKYNYHSNIVLLLPHYLKCENSSKVCNGRPERFLQLVNNFEEHTETNMAKKLEDTNMIVANVSTPANFFHLMRRQMYLPCRRPLVVFTPNLISSHPESKAKFEELSTGTRFQSYFPDTQVDPLDVKRILLCTGKIYYDLKYEREKRGLEKEVSICRIEQMVPLPYELIIKDFMRYFNCISLAWVQEEPINQGWFNYIELRLMNLPNITKIECVARPARADGGSRSMNSCFIEQDEIYRKAFAEPG